MVTWWTDLTNVVPSREPDNDVAHIRESDDVRDEEYIITSL